MSGSLRVTAISALPRSLELSTPALLISERSGRSRYSRSPWALALACRVNMAGVSGVKMSVVSILPSWSLTGSPEGKVRSALATVTMKSLSLRRASPSAFRSGGRFLKYPVVTSARRKLKSIDLAGSRRSRRALAMASTARLTMNSPSAMRPARIFRFTHSRVLGAMMGGHSRFTSEADRSRMRPDNRMPADSPPPVMLPRSRMPEFFDMITRSLMSSRASSMAAVPAKSIRSTATGDLMVPWASMATLWALMSMSIAVSRPSELRTGNTLPESSAREPPTSSIESVMTTPPVAGT